jgi:hypothetical protein
MLPKGFSCAGEDDNGDFQPDFDGGNSDHEAVAESEPDADVWERVDDKVIRHHNVPRQQLSLQWLQMGFHVASMRSCRSDFPKRQN